MLRPEEQAKKAVRARYGRLARIYDWANLERLLYSRARARAIALLDLRPGARVLDIACGTGVSFALIEQRIGPSGRLIGVDLTPQMLGRARDRAARNGWDNVRLYESDVSNLSTQTLEVLGALGAGERFDAALCTLGLSVIPEWGGRLGGDAVRRAPRRQGRDHGRRPPNEVGRRGHRRASVCLAPGPALYRRLQPPALGPGGARHRRLHT